MAILFIHWNSEDNQGYSEWVGSTSWFFQTFTPEVTHRCSSIKIKALRAYTPETVTISIRAVDGGGIPTGSDLVSGTFNGNTITTSLPGEWVEVIFSVPYLLVGGTMYAIIVKAPDANIPGGDALYWRENGTNNNPNWAMPGGHGVGDGSLWSITQEAVPNLMFEVWGTVPGELAGVIAVVETCFHYFDAYGVERWIEGTAVGASQGTAGELKGVIAIAETRFHYLDRTGIERWFEGTAVGVSQGAAGELKGVIAIVETRFHYLDRTGIERWVEGTAV